MIYCYFSNYFGKLKLKKASGLWSCFVEKVQYSAHLSVGYDCLFSITGRLNIPREWRANICWALTMCQVLFLMLYIRWLTLSSQQAYEEVGSQRAKVKFMDLTSERHRMLWTGFTSLTSVLWTLEWFQLNPLNCELFLFQTYWKHFFFFFLNNLLLPWLVLSAI